MIETNTTETEQNLEYMGSLEPYFTLVQNEYSRERDRKQSLETRGGVIITVVTALFAFLVKEINIKEIFELCTKQLTFLMLLQVIVGFAIYISFFICVYFSFRTIATGIYAYFDVSIITPEVLGHKKNLEMLDIIKTYKKVILNHRENNEIKAICLGRAIKSIVACAISTCIYMNIIGA